MLAGRSKTNKQTVKIQCKCCSRADVHLMIIIIIMVILSAISPEPFHIKNGVNMELGKTNRLKALYMMENHT